MSATYIGPAPKDNMNHAAPTLCIKAPISEMTFGIRNWRNVGTCPVKFSCSIRHKSEIGVTQTAP